MRKYLTVLGLFIGFVSLAQTDSSGEVLTEEEIKPLLAKHTCSACHMKEIRVVGPSFKAIAERKYSAKEMVELIYDPKPENWPDFATPMAPMPNVPEEDALKIVNWINSIK